MEPQAVSKEDVVRCMERMKLMSANTAQRDAVRPTKEVIPELVNAKVKAAKEVEADVETAKVKQLTSAFDIKTKKAAAAAASSELDRGKAGVTKVEIMEARKAELKAEVRREAVNLSLSKGTVKVRWDTDAIKTILGSREWECAISFANYWEDYESASAQLEMLELAIKHDIHCNMLPGSLSECNGLGERHGLCPTMVPCKPHG